MSKIKIMAMGGLNENGKNTYCIEVDGSIFIFDVGIKFANEEMYGIDYIIPDYDYLIKNRKRIRGVFLTHAHPENVDGIFDLAKAIPGVKIFATKFTIEYLKLNGFDGNKIVEITAHHKINFGAVSVFPININHSVPDAVMYVVNTKDGAVVYTGDFLIDPAMTGNYSMDLGKIAYVGKLGVLCLMSESSFSERVGHTSPNHKFERFYKDIVNKAQGRLIISLFDDHLYTIQEIFNSLENSHRKVVIMGHKLQKLINMAIENKYLSVKPGTIGNLDDINDARSVIMVSDNKKNQYHNVRKIVDGYDKFITLKEKDTILFAEPSYDYNEKRIVELQNDLALLNVESFTIPKDRNILHHASTEDLMMMIDLLKPKYVMPVEGEYRFMVGNANLASELGIPNENIILKQNGEVVTFENGVLQDKTEVIKINDTLIDGSMGEDVGELVIKDREVLGENGIVLVSASLSKKTKQILVGPEVTTRGFIYVKDSSEMIAEIKRISEDIIVKNTTNEYVDYNNIKTEIREHLGKYFYSETESKPMIIAVIQEI